MPDEESSSYPRPDFVRKELNWLSLNGPWDFLFDDEDAGLQDRWHKNGLPNSVTVSTPDVAADQSEAQSITQNIIGSVVEIQRGNVFKGAPDTRTYPKRKINVPFVFQTPASGINERGAHEVLWYERSITDIRSAEAKQENYRLVVRFGAVDYEATLWLDGQYIGEHQGGHVPFELDVTDATSDGSGSSRLTIRVRDSTYDLTQPRGKQYWAAEPESIFYTPSSGIWQNVWLEVLPPARIADSSHGTILRANDIESGELHSEIAVQGRRSAQNLQVEMSASFAGVTISSCIKDLPREVDTVNLSLPLRLSSSQQSSLPPQNASSLADSVSFSDSLFLWSPSHPNLYDITIRLLSSASALDEVHTTIGLRSLTWTHTPGIFLLNSRPLFQKLCLDQGYWSETGMTPPSPQALKEDIILAQQMGFNGCRKHQKVEDPVFLYWADRLGYLVWGEMANGYKFSDTYCERFDAEWRAAVRRDINHASIVCWTPVNESWGYTDLGGDKRQREHIRGLVEWTKRVDGTRPVNDNCGWEHVAGDLSTFHDYADGEGLRGTCATLEGILGDKAGRRMFVGDMRDAEGRVVDEGSRHREGAPVLCTEMGGVNIQTKGNEGGKDWGYTTASDPEDLVKRVKSLVLGAVQGGQICGFVWTQLTDIEQETNGLYDIDRKEKLDARKVKAILDESEELYLKLLGEREE
ncbi:hypothetical protein CAC42_4270 [Sphaceloma murrayae]|uniref:Glycoside hydrolase family 2 protein n=1 Tax=Sphaceloma murrayae TaxID=2082308 RepID=A0A2K1QKX4_9PEZI|nr:hypothetical protein CAC42_4270 [Sphaceloma murrayae]